jgi:hypothetical protein
MTAQSILPDPKEIFDAAMAVLRGGNSEYSKVSDQVLGGIVPENTERRNRIAK